jgi:hypothetical protein
VSPSSLTSYTALVCPGPLISPSKTMSILIPICTLSWNLHKQPCFTHPSSSFLRKEQEVRVPLLASHILLIASQGNKKDTVYLFQMITVCETRKFGQNRSWLVTNKTCWRLPLSFKLLGGHHSNG